MPGLWGRDPCAHQHVLEKAKNTVPRSPVHGQLAGVHACAQTGAPARTGGLFKLHYGLESLLFSLLRFWSSYLSIPVLTSCYEQDVLLTLSESCLHRPLPCLWILSAPSAHPPIWLLLLTLA